MGTLWFIVIGIAVYMVIYALEWSWNYVEVSPLSLDKKNRTEIAGLTKKLEAIEPSLELQRKTRIRFAKLMEAGATLELSMRITQSNAEFSAMIPTLSDWIKQTVTALTDAGMETDASTFLRAGEGARSAVQLAKFDHVLAWKRTQMAQLESYRDKLQEIVHRNNL